jgi:signal transduction histidine kinase
MEDLLRSRVAKEGRVRDIEFQIAHPSGETRIILASLQILFLDETNTMIVTLIDITERVFAEQQIRRLASELTAAEQAERHRLAQILHDDLQQRLFAIQMHMTFLKDAYDKNDLQSFQADFPQMAEWLAGSIQVTRQLSVDLSPPILRGEGLIEALIWLAAQMQEQYNLSVDIRVEGTPAQIEERVRIMVFNAVRELLFNVVKHSETLEAQVRFEGLDDHLTVVVSDAGKGFAMPDLIQRKNLGHGLESLGHRLRLLGCSFNIHSVPGSGTQAIIEVPYETVETQE